MNGKEGDRDQTKDEHWAVSIVSFLCVLEYMQQYLNIIQGFIAACKKFKQEDISQLNNETVIDHLNMCTMNFMN